MSILSCCPAVIAVFGGVEIGDHCDALGDGCLSEPVQGIWAGRALH